MKNRTFLKYCLMIFGTLVILSLPFLLTMHIDLRKGIDAERFSQYGSYIGGLIGASCAGISLILIVLTYRHQLEAEQIDRVDKLFDSVAAEINDLNYKNFRGIEVFYQFNTQSIHEPQGVLDQLNSLLCNYSALLQTAKYTKFRSKEELSTKMTRIYFLYYSKILWPVHASIASSMKEWIEKNHDDAKIYLKKYEELSYETIEYLTRNNLITGNKKHFGAAE